MRLLPLFIAVKQTHDLRQLAYGALESAAARGAGAELQSQKRALLGGQAHSRITKAIGAVQAHHNPIAASGDTVITGTRDRPLRRRSSSITVVHVPGRG
jgi:hypothetical protein